MLSLSSHWSPPPPPGASGKMKLARAQRIRRQILGYQVPIHLAPPGDQVIGEAQHRAGGPRSSVRRSGVAILRACQSPGVAVLGRDRCRANTRLFTTQSQQVVKFVRQRDLPVVIRFSSPKRTPICGVLGQLEQAVADWRMLTQLGLLALSSTALWRSILG